MKVIDTGKLIIAKALVLVALTIALTGCDDGSSLLSGSFEPDETAAIWDESNWDESEWQ